MKKKRNKIGEFFRPTKWKVIFALVLGIIFFLFTFPREYIVVKDFIGESSKAIDAPIGITNIYIIIVLSIVVGYLISSLILFVWKRIERKRKMRKENERKKNSWKKIFYPKLWKIVISIIITIIWILTANSLSSSIACECMQGGLENCKDYYDYLLVKLSCHCTCISLNGVYWNYFWFLIAPFTVIYLIASIIRRFIKNDHL